MRAGSMDRFITIETPTVTRDDYGSAVTTWSTLVSLRAQLVNRSIDNREGQQTTTDNTATFRTYFYPGVTLDHRVMFEGQAFKITSMRELGRRAGMDLTCERIGK
ncbi:MAG: phage head closure protein [Xanthobacteraceae bacterium]